MPTEPLECIDSFQQRFGTPESFRRARRFMLAYLSELQKPLPSVVIDGMEIMRNYQEGQEYANALEQARMRCWAFIDTNFNSSCLVKSDKNWAPEFSMVRAVLCLIDDGVVPGEDAMNRIALFLQFTDEFVSRPEGWEKILSESFAF